MSYANTFQSNTYPKNTVPTEGSLFLVGYLSGLNPEPATVTITVDTAPTVGDEEISVTASEEITVRKGEIFTFDASNTPKQVVVSAETTIATSATTVPTEPIDTAPSASDTAETWGLARVLSPTALPLSGESNTVDRKDYSFGLQGQEVKTRIDLSSSVEIINQESDKAYHSIILPASMRSDNIFGLVVTGTEHAWGPIQVNSVSDDNAMEEISRPSFDIMYQFPWARVGHHSYLTTDEKDNLNAVRRRAGLAMV